MAGAQAAADAARKSPKQERPLKDFVLSVNDLLAEKLPERKYIVAPWLREQSITIVSSWRGLGKTWFALTLANAIAKGEDFLDYTVTEAWRTLFVDGEMTLADIQEREKALVGDAGVENLDILSHERLAKGGHGGLDIDLPATQEYFDDLFATAEDEGDPYRVIILDNMSSLLSVATKENDGTDIAAFMRYLIRLRARGFAVVLVDHQGKVAELGPRGTSRKEDVVDTSISLTKVEKPQGGGRAEFVMTFTKTRGLRPQPFEQVLILEKGENDLLEWRASEPMHHRFTALAEAIVKGATRQVDLVETLGMKADVVSKFVKKARQAGVLEAEGLKLTGAGLVLGGGVM